MNFANISGFHVNLGAIAYYVERAGGGVTVHFSGGLKELCIPNANASDVCTAIQKAKTNADCEAVQTPARYKEVSAARLNYKDWGSCANK